MDMEKNTSIEGERRLSWSVFFRVVIFFVSREVSCQFCEMTIGPFGDSSESLGLHCR